MTEIFGLGILSIISNFAICLYTVRISNSHENIKKYIILLGFLQSRRVYDYNYCRLRFIKILGEKLHLLIIEVYE